MTELSRYQFASRESSRDGTDQVRVEEDHLGPLRPVLTVHLPGQVAASGASPPLTAALHSFSQKYIIRSEIQDF